MISLSNQMEMNMTKITETREMEQEYADRAAYEWMGQIIDRLQAGAQELSRRQAAFHASCDDEKVKKQRQLGGPVSQLGWFINDMQNIERNIRLDLAPGIAARLALAHR